MAVVEYDVKVSATVVPRTILLDTGPTYEHVKTPDSWTGIPSKEEAVEVFKTFLNIDRLPAGSTYTLTLSEMGHVRGRQWRLYLTQQHRRSHYDRSKCMKDNVVNDNMPHWQ